MRLILISVLITAFYSGYSQTDLESLSLQHARSALPLLKEVLAIPNDAHFPADVEKNVQWCEREFHKRQFELKRLPTSTVPLLLATRPSPGATKTVLVYLQMDGQPVDPSKWFQESPWKPVLKEKSATQEWVEIPWNRSEAEWNLEWRIFGRSSSDAKGPVCMFLAALDAAAATNIVPNYHLKIIMDFEEEIGSPRLPQTVIDFKKDLAADMLIIFDGPRHISNEPTLTFGARGISDVTLTTYGPYVPQHSGHYGNYAPNPALRLSQLLASMKDENGRVTIKGFYDGIKLTKLEKSILKAVPDDEKFIQKQLGIANTDKVGSNYQESIQYPSLNIRGLGSAWIGAASRTIIPATATAELDIRLVMESDPERLLSLLKKHISDQGYYIVSKEPTTEERMKYPKIIFMRAETSYLAFRTAFDSEVGLWLDRAMHKAFGKAPIKIRTGGGSIPISPFVTQLGIPAVIVPTVNSDNNQHSTNENLRLGNFVEGVKTFLSILAEPL